MPDIIALSDLRTIGNLNNNVEARRVANGIYDAHVAAEKVLGRTGYALVYATHASYTDLMVYLKRYMVWTALLNAADEMHVEPDKAGILKPQSGNDFEAANNKDIAGLKATYRARQEAALERLIDHLETTEAYTWYGTTLEGEQRIETPNQTRGGFVFRKLAGQTTYRG